MKLLTVGQSLRGLTNEPSPYKLNEQHFLPKFAPVGRPVSLAPPQERLAQAVPVRSDVRAIAVSPSAIKAVPTTSTAKAPAATEVRRPASGVKEEKGWRAFFAFAARSKPRTRRPLVQGEMTLEMLKVVRNDLSEADLEVVPAKLKPASEPTLAPNDLPQTRSAWSRAADQLSSVTRLWL